MLKFNAAGQELTVESPRIVADSIKYLTAEFTFSSDWDGCTKTAYFRQGANLLKIVLVSNKITADKAMNLTSGTWDVSVVGLKENTTITSSIVPIIVERSGIGGGNPFSVTASEATRIMQQLGGEIGDNYMRSVENESYIKEISLCDIPIEQGGIIASRGVNSDLTDENFGNRLRTVGYISGINKIITGNDNVQILYALYYNESDHVFQNYASIKSSSETIGRSGSVYRLSFYKPNGSEISVSDIKRSSVLDETAVDCANNKKYVSTLKPISLCDIPLEQGGIYTSGSSIGSNMPTSDAKHLKRVRTSGYINGFATIGTGFDDIEILCAYYYDTETHAYDSFDATVKGSIATVGKEGKVCRVAFARTNTELELSVADIKRSTALDDVCNKFKSLLDTLRASGTITDEQYNSLS